MVVLSDKTDYGSFAEPSSSGILIASGSGGTSNSSTAVGHGHHQSQGGVNSSSGTNNSNSNSNNSHTGSVSSNSNSLTSSVRSIASESVSGVQSASNNSNNNTRSGTRSVGNLSVNPNVHLGLGLELGLGVQKDIPVTEDTSAVSICFLDDSNEDSREGTRVRASTSRIRTASGNNNTFLKGSQPILRLSPTDTIVIVSSGTKNSSGKGTTTQAYSNSSSPMSTNSGDLLYQRQPLLQQDENGWIEQDDNLGLAIDSISSSGKRGRDPVRIDITSDQSVVTTKRYPKEKRKTVLAFLILCCNFVLATLSLALTHERVPDRTTYAPLPDIILDNVITQDWALDVSDILVAISALTTFVVMLLHRHRWIVFRRVFLILGCLYMMRSLTMYVTVLPVASYTYTCSPKANSTSVWEIARRVVKLVSGFGLSINGQHTYCGDYIYSGHTVILVTAYLFIQEYTPRKLVYLHWASWTTSFVGVIMMLISRGHYTVDILIAYYVATRLFWIYHTLANNPHLKVQSGQNGSSNNFLSRIWWFPVFRYMEGNVGGELPRKYSYPWSSKEHRSRRSI